MTLRALQYFKSDRRGSVATMTGLTAGLVMVFAAVSIDTSNLYYAKRRQQTATDFAALAAASNIGSASAAATTSVGVNGYSAADVASIEFGSYASDPTVAAGQRFTPQSGGTPNAVRLTMQKTQPYLFSGVIGSRFTGVGGSTTGAPITTRAIATTRNVAAFSLGSGLASLNGGIANGVLSSLLGSSVSLSAMDYQALASTNISLFTFSSALATRANLAAGTYGQVAGATVTLGAALGALADAARSSSQSAAALAAIQAALATPSRTLNLGTLVNFGPYGSLALGATGPLTASTSAFDMLSALLQVANGQQQVETALNINLPGIVSASLKLAIGEPAVGTSLITLGTQGTTLTTAQTRLRLTLQLAGPAPAGLMTVPIVMNVASATAVLNTVQCPAAGVTASSVGLGVKPGLADAWIGTVSDQDLAGMATPLSPSDATLVNLLGLLKITGRAHATIANTAVTAVSFSYTDILSSNRKTVSTTDFVAPLLTSLFGNLSLTISAAGFPLLSTSALNLSILSTLANNVAPIDTLLSSVLSTVGVSVGNATTWVSGIRCGQSVLVN